MEKFTSLKKINETDSDFINQGMVRDPADGLRTFTSNPAAVQEVTKSEPAKFVSKIFEARQMAHVFHLQATGDGSYALHMALDAFYNGILELNDELIEVYQGQYDIIGDYETIEGTPSAQNAIQYFIELAQFIKDTRQMAFLPEDTHLQNIIDEMVSLVYKTLYKLKNLK